MRVGRAGHLALTPCAHPMDSPLPPYCRGPKPQMDRAGTKHKGKSLRAQTLRVPEDARDTRLSSPLDHKHPLVLGSILPISQRPRRTPETLPPPTGQTYRHGKASGNHLRCPQEPSQEIPRLGPAPSLRQTCRGSHGGHHQL